MAKEHCQPIRDSIASLENDIREAQALLPEVHGAVLNVIKNFIKSETAHLKRMRAALRACEAGK